jgi:hypothetical protein
VKNLKYIVLACGIVGLLGVFLPMVSLGDESISLWKAREGDAAQVYMVMVGYVLGIVGAVLGMKAMQWWNGLISLAGFLFVAFKFRIWNGFLSMLTDGAIGAKMMWIGCIAGVIFAILSMIKSEKPA